jgi:hypothetical protein
MIQKREQKALFQKMRSKETIAVVLVLWCGNIWMVGFGCFSSSDFEGLLYLVRSGDSSRMCVCVDSVLCLLISLL